MRLAAAFLLVLVTVGCSPGEQQDPYAAPADIEALIADWDAANSRGDGSVLELYVPEGYHLYGDTRIEYDELTDHFGGGLVQHEWLTDPILINEDLDGRYVVARGLRNSTPLWSSASALLFEIVTTPAGELRIVQTAWFYDSEWAPDA